MRKEAHAQGLKERVVEYLENNRFNSVPVERIATILKVNERELQNVLDQLVQKEVIEKIVYPNTIEYQHKSTPYKS